MNWRASFLTVLCFAVFGVGQGVAQTAQTNIPASDLQAAAARSERERSNLEQADAARRAQSRSESPRSRTPVPGPDPFAPAPGGPCFKIRDIRLSGFEAFGEKPEGYRSLIGRCVTAADIGEALNAINTYYQAQGFITTRAYVPEQDLADGALDITIVPGRIEGFIYGDGRPSDGRIQMAFPTKPGRLLNLRDLEQGLENINAPRSAQAQFQLLPGEHNGGSVVQIQAQNDTPLHASLSLDNSGFESTGKYNTRLSLGIDNMAQINDQLALDLSSSGLEDRSGKFSDSAVLSWSFPAANWSFSFTAGTSRYFFVLNGINQSYDVTGRSTYMTYAAERLLTRNQTAKIYAFGDLKLSRSKSFIDGFEIESQRRRSTVARLGLRGEKSWNRGKLTWSVNGKFGLDAFDAYVLDKSIVDPNFRKIETRLSYEHKVSEKTVLRSTFAAQHANAILPGIEQFSIGSRATVRGFHDDSMYGDTGAYLRNDLEYLAHKANGVELRLTSGLDFGWVRPSQLRRWSQDHLAGASVGAELKLREKATLTIEVARALSRPDKNPPNAQPAFEANPTLGYVGLKIDF